MFFSRFCGRFSMRAFILAFILSGCTVAPDYLIQAKDVVDRRMTYVYYRGWSKPSWVGENQGNCAAFAIGYWAELKRKGYKPPIPITCVLPDGTRHAVLDVDGWRLDNRYTWVMPVTESDCREL